MSSSEDGAPVQKAIAPHGANSDSSDMPSWLKDSQPPADDQLAQQSNDSGGIPEEALHSDGAAAALQRTPGAQTAPITGSQSAAKPLAAAAGGGVLGAGPGEVPLVLPEKLARSKMLVELELAGGATDLSGDAGAVGRIVVPGDLKSAGASGPPTSFHLDLKGVLYLATAIPLAGSAMVVNIGPTEAKVESLFNDFVRLREDSSNQDSGMTLQAGALEGLMGDSDADEDRAPGAAAAAGAEGAEGGKQAVGAGKKGGKPRKQAASVAGMVGRATKVLKPAKGGVKKKAGKKKAAAKPKAAKKAATGGGKAATGGGKAAAGGGKAAAGGGKAAAGGAKKRKPQASSDESSSDASEGEESEWNSG